MKLTTLYALPMVALGAKVPRDSPVRKILKLKRFANEWLSNHFGQDEKVHQHWMQKITRNALRFKVIFVINPIFVYGCELTKAKRHLNTTKYICLQTSVK